MLFPCPCCGYKTLSKGGGNSFEICPICYWEDDGVQLRYPNSPGGANPISLNEARENYKKFGASEEAYILRVRKPEENEERDVFWENE